MPTLTNPADAYKTWLMGVRRTLQRTGYPEAAKHVGQYDRDLRGVFLSGAGPAEGAGVVSRRWQGGYNANVAYGGSGWLIGLSALAVGGLMAYLAFRPTPAAAGSPKTLSCPTDLSSLNTWASAAGIQVWVKHPFGNATVVGVQSINGVGTPSLYWKEGEGVLHAGGFDGPTDTTGTKSYCDYVKSQVTATRAAVNLVGPADTFML